MNKAIESVVFIIMLIPAAIILALQSIGKRPKQTVYTLRNYRFKNGKIYHKRWFMYKCIDKGPYTDVEGIKQVYTHCSLEPWRGMLP